MASTGDESHRESNKRVQGESHEVETNGGKAAAPGGPARAPSSSAVTADANWQRKRSAVLLNVMHPENTRETAAFVDRLPRSAALRVLFALFAYALLVSDVPRAGSSVDSLPFVQIEPNVFTVYGPTALPGHTIFRNGSIITDGESLISSEIPTALYKFTPSSYGLRTARDLLETSPKLNSSWPACILSAHSTDSVYSSDCGDSLPGTTVFSMLDTLAEALAANAPSTTSYKNVAQTDDGIAIMARGELSSLPQRVCFAARAKARWTGTSSASSGSTAASSSTSFLSRNLLDHKYWLSVWVTTFADLDPANPGVDLCVDDLDRPLFCEKPWAASLTVDGSERDALWETVSLRTAALQQNLSKNEKLDITLIEAESDPLTRLGGAVLLAHKIYNVVVLYRIRDCTNPTSALRRPYLTSVSRARFSTLMLWSGALWHPLCAILASSQGGIAVDDRDARILEANEVEPVPTFMLLRSETLDAWKMNLEGVYSDMLAVALAAIIYVVVILAVRALMRWHRRRWVKPTNFSQVKPQEKGDAVPDPLFFARSAVPSAAGALWEPSCLSVSWDDDLLGPLLTMLNVTPWISQRNLDKKQGTSQDNTDNNVANDEIGTSSASTAQRMLMNLVFLSDPWNLLVLKLGRARVHLYHLRGNGLNCKVVHANAKARVAREYSLALENVELVASLRASELSWSQLVTCK
ncbi:Vacuolar protein sorting-associated protein 16 [Phytophthora nicotianae]|uniref:Vacuolar protein sorting-associated protein 16 n=1 Tax=Phytophthora nicotianae TaxID=4792 RepID=A0A0W8DME4_PHYNI|nr:Vacuolar protein sorting-associated protein 16 [Phytophthora nicotianae]